MSCVRVLPSVPSARAQRPQQAERVERSRMKGFLSNKSVQSANNMDDETFCKHMTFRHHESLGGLAEIWPNGATEAWRAYHDRLHNVLFFPFKKLHDHGE